MNYYNCGLIQITYRNIKLLIKSLMKYDELDNCVVLCKRTFSQRKCTRRT